MRCQKISYDIPVNFQWVLTQIFFKGMQGIGFSARSNPMSWPGDKATQKAEKVPLRQGEDCKTCAAVLLPHSASYTNCASTLLSGGAGVWTAAHAFPSSSVCVLLATLFTFPTLPACPFSVGVPDAVFCLSHIVHCTNQISTPHVSYSCFCDGVVIEDPT